MIYQSSIFLKGRGTGLTVSKRAAEEVSAIFSDKKYESDFPINLGGKHHFRKGEIKGIEILPDINKTRQEEDRIAFYEEEKREREKMIKMSPKARASYTDMFFYLYKLTTGDIPSESILSSVRVVQEMFFVKNPKRIVCDPSAFKHLIPIVKGKKMGENDLAIKLSNSYFHFVEMAVIRDMQLSK